MNCPLCGYDFEPARLECHAACPLAQGCAIVCCPNCGYQMVDEDRSRLAGWLRRLWPAAPRPELGEEPRR